MINATHTPGKLTVSDFGHRSVNAPQCELLARLHGADYRLASVTYPTTTGDTVGAAERLANARRLAAAWNACDGLPTAALERGAVAEMLAACRTLDGVDCCEGYSLGDADYPKFWAALAMARAALAKLEAAP